MKIYFGLIFILFLFSKQTFCNSTPSFKEGTPFNLYFAIVGLGSNLGDLEPTVRISNHQLFLTHEQNSSWFGSSTQRPDSIASYKIRLSSIDSILSIVKPLGDTIIREYNFCVMSGAMYILEVVNNFDTTRFELTNTFHQDAIKIIKVLNSYLTDENQIYIDENSIQDAQDCWEDIIKRINNKKDIEKRKKKNGM